MAEVIRLDEVVAFSGSFPLLARANLVVEAGEVVHLNGANGAGKTSLLRAIAGLVPISEGTITVLGYDLVRDRRTVRKEVGLIGHQTFLYEDLDARSNLEFWIGASHSRRYSATEALARVGLKDRLVQTPVGKLSTGQRRRVTLALLFARYPRLWLLDEPHAGLDLDARAIVDDMIVEAATSGTTVVLASHEIEHVRSIVTRSVRMAGGRIVEGVSREIEGISRNDP